MNDTTTAPWPIVGECHYPAPSMVKRDHACRQCDGSHDHEWAVWREAPQSSPGTYVVDGHSGPGLPVRCKGLRRPEVRHQRLHGPTTPPRTP